MALLRSSPLVSFSSISVSSSLSSSTLAITAGTPITGLLMKPIIWHPKMFSGVCVCTPSITNKRAAMIVKVASDIHDGGSESQSENDDHDDEVPFNKLPLDCKLQQKLEHKMRMKLSKKIRLRSKKIERKRRMRKKGRWPLSKMKKLSNV